MEKLEAPNWHLKGRRHQAQNSKITNCDLKKRPRPASKVPAVGFYRARCDHGSQCFEQPASRADERVCRPRVFENASFTGRQTRVGPKTCLARKGTEKKTRRSRSRHRDHFTTRDGHN